MNKVRKILGLPGAVWQMFVTYLPGEFGHWLRFRHWRRRLAHVGAGTRIDVGAHFENPAWIHVGEHCWIDRHVLILAGPPRDGRVTKVKANEAFALEVGRVQIGANTHIAPNCVLSGHGGIWIGANCGVASGSAIYSYSHHYRNLVDRDDRAQYSFTPLARPDQQAMVLGPVVLQDYCAIGLHAVVLPGVTLSRGTWVASGLVVTGSYPDQTLAFAAQEVQTRCLEDLEIKV